MNNCSLYILATSELSKRYKQKCENKHCWLHHYVCLYICFLFCMEPCCLLQCSLGQCIRTTTKLADLCLEVHIVVSFSLKISFSCHFYTNQDIDMCFFVTCSGYRDIFLSFFSLLQVNISRRYKRY